MQDMHDRGWCTARLLSSTDSVTPALVRSSSHVTDQPAGKLSAFLRDKEATSLMTERTAGVGSKPVTRHLCVTYYLWARRHVPMESLLATTTWFEDDGII
jgi:hypothetical protein